VDIPLKKKLITIHEKWNLTESLKVLIDNKILSAPVVKDDGSVVGQIDVVDLVVFVVHLSKRAQEIFMSLGLIGKQHAIDFSEVHVDERIENLFLAYDESSAIVNFSKRNPMKCIPPTSTFPELCTALIHNHRVSVINSANGKIENYITQSDIIKIFFKNRELLGVVGNKSIGQLNIGTVDVISVKKHDQLIEAFKQIAIKGVSAVAVIDAEGCLLGDITAHDMHEVNPEVLLMTVIDYIKTSKEPKNILPCIVSSSTLLGEVITILEQNHTHRVWIVGDGKLKGIISIGDILKCLYTQ